jgi:serine/threonine protein phosphatase 1
MSTLAIGDIHGCHRALVELLSEVNPSADDQLVFLGDYIDRGPDSRSVIDILCRRQQLGRAVFLRGNHEVMVLDARADPLKANLWQSYGGVEALYSYGAERREDWVLAIPEAHWAFLERTVRFFETPDHIFVHACLAPDLNMDEQPDWLLFWEFFERIQPHKSGKTVICGHTPQHSGQPKDRGFAICIDTAPAAGGWLTCLDPNSGRYWQADGLGHTRTRRLRP